MTQEQEQQLRELLAQSLKYAGQTQEDEEWTDAYQYGENAYDAYHNGINDGRTEGEASLARKVLAILNAK